MSNNDNNLDLFHFGNMGGEDQDILPIITIEEVDHPEKDLPSTLALLPLRNTVLFPGVVIPITIGRDKSIRLVNDANKKSKILGVIAQKDDSEENPGPEDINKIGTLARILKMIKMPDGNTTVIIQGRRRLQIESISQTEPYMRAEVKYLEELSKIKGDKEFKELIRTIKEVAQNLIELSPHIPSEASVALKNIEQPDFLINFIASNLNVKVEEKQNLLELSDLKERATSVLELLYREHEMLKIRDQIQNKVRFDLDKQQREYFLHQQLKTIQEELGGSTPDLEVEDLKARGTKKKWPVDVALAFDKELNKLSRMNPAAADYSVVLNHVELMLDLPWGEYSKDRINLVRAKRILDQDHYGLEKVKERILEYLAVLKLKNDMKAPILCLVGPPGVGKTSLGRSIARAVNRKYVRMSLGGVRDEASIRGHRKTYIGALPGRIIQSIKKAQTSNPVMVLDEVDKVGMDYRGDVSSALLEVLDPEQNHSFFDHYLEQDYDLSRVMFIATANSLAPVQPALLDRMEVIFINGYTVEEKMQIAKKYLIPKQLREHGLVRKQFSLNQRLIEFAIDNYTRESGVRSLDKVIAQLVRGVAKRTVLDEIKTPKVSKELLLEILGSPKFEKDKYNENKVAGVAVGLAWTSVGGDILYIESNLNKGKGALHITGNLGNVMKESARVALAYLRANANKYGIDSSLFQNTDINLHVPEGATPKDGPSAGITMLTSLASSFTQRKVRPQMAMTGEITLRGKVLPVGGIKEKILAAKRAGIKEIILCSKNKKDIEEIKADYIKDLRFHYVETMDDVLELALMNQKVKGAVNLSQFLTAEAQKN